MKKLIILTIFTIVTAIISALVQTLIGFKIDQPTWKVIIYCVMYELFGAGIFAIISWKGKASQI